MDLVLTYQFQELVNLSAEERLKLFIQWAHRPIFGMFSCSAFLKLIGLKRSDPKLASLKTSKGWTVLHVVAERLMMSLDYYPSWVDLGACILRNGAEPSSVAQGNLGEKCNKSEGVNY